jgi:hypothetical protein
LAGCIQPLPIPRPRNQPVWRECSSERRCSVFKSAWRTEADLRKKLQPQHVLWRLIQSDSKNHFSTLRVSHELGPSFFVFVARNFSGSISSLQGLQRRLHLPVHGPPHRHHEGKECDPEYKPENPPISMHSAVVIHKTSQSHGLIVPLSSNESALPSKLSHSYKSKSGPFCSPTARDHKAGQKSLSSLPENLESFERDGSAPVERNDTRSVVGSRTFG